MNEINFIMAQFGGEQNYILGYTPAAMQQARNLAGEWLIETYKLNTTIPADKLYNLIQIATGLNEIDGVSIISIALGVNYLVAKKIITAFIVDCDVYSCESVSLTSAEMAFHMQKTAMGSPEEIAGTILLNVRREDDIDDVVEFVKDNSGLFGDSWLVAMDVIGEMRLETKDAS